MSGDGNLDFCGGGRVSVPVENIVRSPGFEDQCKGVAEIAAMQSDCVCDGNLRSLLKEYAPFFGWSYVHYRSRKKYTFVGILIAEDDMYYDMYRKGEHRLLSCVGSLLEGWGFQRVPRTP